MNYGDNANLLGSNDERDRVRGAEDARFAYIHAIDPERKAPRRSFDATKRLAEASEEPCFSLRQLRSVPPRDPAQIAYRTG
jgi:hypothetical protein